MHFFYSYPRSLSLSVNLLLREYFLLGVVFYLGIHTVYAQELSLFEETESSRSEQDNRVDQARRRDDDGNIINAPEFTLIGTTRIGEKYLIVMRDRDGEIISINVRKGVVVSIPGHQGFEIVEFGSGDVVINYPEGLDCIEYDRQGVTCKTAHSARLTLANLKPLENSTRTTLNSENVSVANSPDIEISSNPFEALLERAASSQAEEGRNTFEPVRINPKDVPPGMRVVSTPFGDRLVEEE